MENEVGAAEEIHSAEEGVVVGVNGLQNSVGDEGFKAVGGSMEESIYIDGVKPDSVDNAAAEFCAGANSDSGSCFSVVVGNSILAENVVEGSIEARDSEGERSEKRQVSQSYLETSDSGTGTITKNDTSGQLTSGIAVGDRLASAERGFVEGGKREDERESSRASKETCNPAQTANPAVPPTRPAGLGQPSQAEPNIFGSTKNAGEVEEGDEIHKKLEMMRVKFLRLAHRLGKTPRSALVGEVLLRLGIAGYLGSGNGEHFDALTCDRAIPMAKQLEATGKDSLDFSCTIMVIGKTGVGKSATINSIFDEVKSNTDAFEIGTKKVQVVVGTVQGIKVRVIDTPGLLLSCYDQHKNLKILLSVKNSIKKCPPDVVLYLDRLDKPSKYIADLPMLRSVTKIFGTSIWFNTIVAFTHAGSAPLEGPNGDSSAYETFLNKQMQCVQEDICQAAGDMLVMCPISLVENHWDCRTNRAGQRVLPNGHVWKPHLLLLCFAHKILGEAQTLLQHKDTPPGTRKHLTGYLPFLLPSLLQSQPQSKLPEALELDEDDIDDESDDEEYDELPPFRPLTKAELEEVSKDLKERYYDELKYREFLLMKKQMKKEKKRLKMMKKMVTETKSIPQENTENVEEKSGGAASSVFVPMPDLALPASIDSDNPTYQYRYLATSNQWLVSPVLDNHGWDHDVGYEGVNFERVFDVKKKISLSFSGQVLKDKKEADLVVQLASSIKHGEGKATMLGLDVQRLRKDMTYNFRGETRFSNYKHSKATFGLSGTLLGDALLGGGKLEHKLIVNKQIKVVTSGGVMAGHGDVACGGTLEATFRFRDKDYPLHCYLTTLGLSVMDLHGVLASGCNIQIQIPVGRFTNLIAGANLNNWRSGQLSLKVNSSEHLQLGLIGLVPMTITFGNWIFSRVRDIVSVIDES